MGGSCSVPEWDGPIWPGGAEPTLSDRVNSVTRHAGPRGGEEDTFPATLRRASSPTSVVPDWRRQL